MPGSKVSLPASTDKSITSTLHTYSVGSVWNACIPVCAVCASTYLAYCTCAMCHERVCVCVCVCVCACTHMSTCVWWHVYDDIPTGQQHHTTACTFNTRLTNLLLTQNLCLTSSAPHTHAFLCTHLYIFLGTMTAVLGWVSALHIYSKKLANSE